MYTIIMLLYIYIFNNIIIIVFLALPFVGTGRIGLQIAGFGGTLVSKLDGNCRTGFLSLLKFHFAIHV